MTIGKRLKEERERIGLSQPLFGGLADVVKQTVIQWEKGTSAPTAVQLVALSGAGVDVFYVLTGHRVGGLSPEESALLANYRAIPAERKFSLIDVASALATAHADKKEAG